jgi:hypothetical protein
MTLLLTLARLARRWTQRFIFSHLQVKRFLDSKSKASGTVLVSGRDTKLLREDGALLQAFIRL